MPPGAVRLKRFSLFQSLEANPELVVDVPA
jgi:hypothetical protein